MREKHKQQMCTWAMLCHFSALLGWILLFFLVYIGIPFCLPLNILAPLVIWRFKKSQYSWIDFQGKESLNFQISLTLYILLIIIVSLLLILVSFGLAVTTNDVINPVKMVLNILLLSWMWVIIILMLLQAFLVTFAAIKAYRGEHFRYPVTIRILK